MSFGPANALPLYTIIMKWLKDEWDTLLIMRLKTLENIGNDPAEVTNSEEILAGKTKLSA